MNNEINQFPSPVNHVFVDYENVQTVDPTIIGSKTVHVTLLLGPQKAKLDATVVERLLEHVPTVQMIRLTSSGRNALDFALAYYLGRAAQADPYGSFHVVSKDKGYDALLEHLRSKQIQAHRHNDFKTLTFSVPAKPATSVPRTTKPARATAKPSKPPTVALPALDARVWEYLRKPTTNRPRTKAKLTSHLVTHLANKVAQSEVLKLITRFAQSGKLIIDEKEKITYHLDRA